MTYINIKDYYYCYTQTRFVNEANFKEEILSQFETYKHGQPDISDEAALELLAASPLYKKRWRKIQCNKDKFQELLKEFKDGLIEVSDEVFEALLADKRYHLAHAKRMQRNSVISLDNDDGVSQAADLRCADLSPEDACGLIERHCSLCRALNSLPDKQGRRIDAHYLQGISVAEIAVADGASAESVYKSIRRGRASMKKYLHNSEHEGSISCGGCL